MSSDLIVLTDICMYTVFVYYFAVLTVNNKTRTKTFWSNFTYVILCKYNKNI